MTTLAKILGHKIVAILRGADPDQILPIANALHEGGIYCIEVTLNSTDALGCIEMLSQKLKGHVIVGAGTVLNASSAKKAIAAGAQFIVSPITDEETIKVTKGLDAVSMPGAFTPTEIYKAHSLGGDIIKVFPGTSGPAFIKEIRAPLPFIPLMPTGGINLHNIAEFKNAGAVAFGIGKSLVDTKKEMNKESVQQITANAQKFLAAIADIREIHK